MIALTTYIPLDVQSSYSIGKSICTIPRLAHKARAFGLSALALTDDGFLFGAKEFYNECRRLGGSYGDLPPIKPVIGLPIDVSEDGVLHTIRLLAKNADGYHNLVRIASEGAAKVFGYLVGKYGEDHVARIATFGMESPRSATRNVARVIDEFREKFIVGCLANPEFRIGVWRDESAARALAGKIFRSWEKFTLYAFCKAHALCYALLAYRSAYLKAHWPEEFEKALDISRDTVRKCI
jgi:DNA polymerase III alpha subunit